MYPREKNLTTQKLVHHCLQITALFTVTVEKVQLTINKGISKLWWSPTTTDYNTAIGGNAILNNAPA
jgi:hypothetical protein